MLKIQIKTLLRSVLLLGVMFFCLFGILQAQSSGNHIKISREELRSVVQKIKDRFTQILAIFLEYQLDYILKRKELSNNDSELFFIFGTLFYNQIMFLKRSEKKAHYQREWVDEMLHVGNKKGINAMSISDLTEIPRPTVIRKLKILLKQKDIIKDGNSLYYLSSGKMLSEFNKQRLINIKKLSHIISRINNIVFFS